MQDRVVHFMHIFIPKNPFHTNFMCLQLVLQSSFFVSIISIVLCDIVVKMTCVCIFDYKMTLSCIYNYDL